MDDLISRKAVLDYIDNMPSELTADGRRMIRRIRLTEYIQDSLPSVQPLVLTCDGCRHVGTYDTDFPCSGCIRREKDYYEQER